MGGCKPEVGKHVKFQSYGCRAKKSGGQFEGLLHTSPRGLDGPWTRDGHEKEYDKNKR